ncbi:bifunctional 4-hydroxy-2-oxoglutarate aldolase/2-dehydro-3-deoxy-phosphogluconate aldolase [Lysobacter sp. D1-1-M9]|uniref:bifunctional 4-hydroxy-2-oxoglutarate aldolase/2-dehydro-3-deoxy-phosphogluconate aldolase n=1 Tax=Novilysobacter longmucuonensis TaxID=3098603 RepID=UPI002FC759AD
MTRSAAAALLYRAGVMPVVTVRDADSAVRIARALIEGGLGAIEVTLRSDAALDAIAAIRREVPGMSVGAGTVLDAGQLQAAQDAGAQFVVTPGTPPVLAEALMAAAVPVVPGAASVSEILALAARGFDAVKLFPAEPLGGAAMVKALRGPLPAVGLCPTGGIVEAQLPDYLAQPNVLCVGGSWLVRDEWLAAGDFAAVRDVARRAAEALAAARDGS